MTSDLTFITNEEDKNLLKRNTWASEFPDTYLRPEWLKENEAEWGTQSGFIKKGQNSKARPANAEEINGLKRKLGIA